jgi:hypothetical protein
MRNCFVTTLVLAMTFISGCDIEYGSVGGECPCDAGLICVVSDNGLAEVCAKPSIVEPCDHAMPVDLPGRSVDGGCVPSCVQFQDDCGDLVCAPVDAFATGFCAHQIIL